MSDVDFPKELVFDVLTPLGFQVHATRIYWNLIVTLKHPVMAGCEKRVMDVLQYPSEVRRSKSDGAVYLFYQPDGVGRWICAVAKRLEREGFLITAYPTDSMKEGEIIWTP